MQPTNKIESHKNQSRSEELLDTSMQL
jgi:hypothetical protein